MKTLNLQKGETSPEILFNPHSFEFTLQGECRPENVLTYFKPILTWLDEFESWIENKPELTKEILFFHFKLEYYNSSSAKFIYLILEKLKNYKQKGLNVQVHWYYNELDEDLLENGKEFERILFLPFYYHPQQ